MSLASSDMCVQGIEPSGSTIMAPPSCAGCPILRPCMTPSRAMVTTSLARTAGPSSTQSGHLGARNLVADPLLVGQHREIDLQPAPEVRGLTGRRLTDQEQARAGVFDAEAIAMQLHRV